jgi:hypothetical protein
MNFFEMDIKEPEIVLVESIIEDIPVDNVEWIHPDDIPDKLNMTRNDILEKAKKLYGHLKVNDEFFLICMYYVRSLSHEGAKEFIKKWSKFIQENMHKSI